MAGIDPSLNILEIVLSLLRVDYTVRLQQFIIRLRLHQPHTLHSGNFNITFRKRQGHNLAGSPSLRVKAKELYQAFSGL